MCLWKENNDTRSTTIDVVRKCIKMTAMLWQTQEKKITVRRMVEYTYSLKTRLCCISADKKNDTNYNRTVTSLSQENADSVIWIHTKNWTKFPNEKYWQNVWRLYTKIAYFMMLFFLPSLHRPLTFPDVTYDNLKMIRNY